MSRFVMTMTALICAALLASGCKGGDEANSGNASGEAGAAGEEGAIAGERGGVAGKTSGTKEDDRGAPGEANAASAAGPAAGRVFDKDVQKKGCAMLAPRLVADTFGIPEGELEQRQLMGCLYTWESDVEQLEAHVMTIRAHRSAESAARWFANATTSRTAEEMAEALKQVKGQVQKQEALDTDLKKETANALLDGIGARAVSFEDVDAGDEARVSDDGSVYVRVGNLTFTVAAYKGAKQPEMPMPEQLTPEAIAAAGKKHAAEWAEKTRAQRKTDGARLAKSVADGL